MVKPVLNKPYTPSYLTDIRQAFDLERHRLTTDDFDRLNEAFGAALAVALVDAARVTSSNDAQGRKP